MIELIYENILRKVSEKAGSISKVVREAKRKTLSILKAISNKLKQVDCAVLSEEADGITTELNSIYKYLEQISSEIDSTESIETISNLSNEINDNKKNLADCMLRINLLRFYVQLETTRVHNETTLSIVEDQLHRLYEAISDSYQLIDTHIEHLCSYSSLLNDKPDKVHDEHRKKTLDDIATQFNVLNFYLRTEITKMRSVISKERESRFMAIVDKALENASKVYAIKSGLRNPEINVDYELTTLSKGIHSIYESLNKEGIDMADMGGTVLFLAYEYKRFADAVN